MRRAIVSVSASFFIIAMLNLIPERGGMADEVNVKREWTYEEFAGAEGILPDYFMLSAQADTYNIVYFDFEVMDWQGWTRVDNTAQHDTFFHADDFAGLGGGTYGGLVPLEGTMSMWCGARPDPNDPYLKTWVTPPGYGNRWSQMLISDTLLIDSGPIQFSYSISYHSAPGDTTFVEMKPVGEDWVRLAAYCGHGGDMVTHDIMYVGLAIFRFRFESGISVSDEDGLYDSDGSVILDEILFRWSDYPEEDFEDWPVGASDYPDSSIWHGRTSEGYWTYSGLQQFLYDKDPCNDNYFTRVVFYMGSPYPSDEYPGLYDTPYCLGPGGLEAPCQDEIVVSPLIDMTRYSTNNDENQDIGIPPGELPQLGGAQLRFTVYRDLPLPNLVFYKWHVRCYNDGQPGPWKDRGLVYYGAEKDYQFMVEDISDLVGNDTIQVAVGIVDMCDAWYNVFFDCTDHTPSPWFDNVQIRRYKTTGPKWSYRDIDLFQDNFPDEEIDLESYVRADMAQDINPKSDPVILPGDSIVVSCGSPLGGGIDTTPDGRPMVYMHVRCRYIGDPGSPKPDLYGPTLEGTYGTYHSDDGTWTIFQGDYATIEGSYSLPDKYMFDLNDSLFTRGYIVEYYFKAWDRVAETSTLPGDAEARERYFEFTCLPTLASDILYVDDFHGRGTLNGAVQEYFDNSFRAVLPQENQPDRYDVNGPSSLVSNGPGSRAKLDHLVTAYDKIIWDSGNLRYGTISDGTSRSDKSNDCRMLLDWASLSEHDVGLWICGDNVAADLVGSISLDARDMLDTCGFGDVVVYDSYFELTGTVSPDIYEEAAGIFAVPIPDQCAGADTFSLFGGCPIINSFDVFDSTGYLGDGSLDLRYEHFTGNYFASLRNHTLNAGGYDVKTMWFGFSFMYIRDWDLEGPPPIIRNCILANVVSWFENDINPDITETETPKIHSYFVKQNFPNPFNPVTVIDFGLRDKGPVTLKIYNVAGQLVRTLVDEVREAGVYRETWDGRNNLGVDTASGVYFYRIKSGEFSRTRKMVLLR